MSSYPKPPFKTQQQPVPGDLGSADQCSTIVNVEVAPIHALLTSDEGSYISAERYGVTGGKPIL